MKTVQRTAEESIGLRPEETRSLRKFLLARKAELMDSYLNLEDHARRKGNEAGELSAVPYHPADRGTDSFEQSLSLALLANESSALREIDAALERIARGTYGTCARCGAQISEARLAVLPQTPLCEDCAAGK